MSHRELLQQSTRIFNTLDRWNALFEIYDQSEAIIETWMEAGAEALRGDFTTRPSAGWTCEKWEAKRETKWFLSDLGRDSISLVFAWPAWEFHLLFKMPAEFDETKARQLLKQSEFRSLAGMFDPDEVPSKGGNYRPLASDLTFNPFSGVAEKNARRRELAWHAALDTDRFVAEMSKHVRRITDNPALTSLVLDLNRRAKLDLNG